MTRRLHFPLLTLCVLLVGCTKPADPAGRVADPSPSRSGTEQAAETSPQSDESGGLSHLGFRVGPEVLEKIRASCAAPIETGGSEGYQGPIIDAHVHTAVNNSQGPFALALLDEMNRTGVTRVLVQLDHSPDLTSNPGLLELYREVEATWGEIAAVCPRFLTLIYAFDPADDSSWSYVRERLETGQYAGVGEIEFLHSRQNIRKPVHSKTLDQVYEALTAREGIFHLQATTADDPALAREIEELIRSYPKIRFVWFAGRDCFKLTGLRNLTCTVFPNHYMQRFDRFPIQGKDRVVLGTDHSPLGFHSASAGHLPYDSFAEGIVEARRLLMDIDPHWRDGVAHKNFDELVPDGSSRAKKAPTAP